MPRNFKKHMRQALSKGRRNRTQQRSMKINKSAISNGIDATIEKIDENDFIIDNFYGSYVNSSSVEIEIEPKKYGNDKWNRFPQFNSSNSLQNFHGIHYSNSQDFSPSTSSTNNTNQQRNQLKKSSQQSFDEDEIIQEQQLLIVMRVSQGQIFLSSEQKYMLVNMLACTLCLEAFNDSDPGILETCLRKVCKDYFKKRYLKCDSIYQQCLVCGSKSEKRTTRLGRVSDILSVVIGSTYERFNEDINLIKTKQDAHLNYLKQSQIKVKEVKVRMDSLRKKEKGTVIGETEESKFEKQILKVEEEYEQSSNESTDATLLDNNQNHPRGAIRVKKEELLVKDEYALEMEDSAMRYSNQQNCQVKNEEIEEGNQFVDSCLTEKIKQQYEKDQDNLRAIQSQFEFSKGLQEKNNQQKKWSKKQKRKV